MKTTEQIEILLSKSKLSLLLAGSIAFVAIGFWFVIDSKDVATSGIRQTSPIFILVGGIVTILFFGICGVAIAKKLTSHKPGIVINNEGILDNSGGISTGLILWKDIKQIKTINIANQNMVVIIVRNPEEYIDRQANSFKKKMMQLNYKKHESPIVISANGLKCSFNDLYNLLKDELTNHSTPASI
jgi:hypothetical protein